jgi:hypothetical protein
MTEDHGGGRVEVSASEFRALFDAVTTWGRWGEWDQNGALHHLDPAHVVAAARLVRAGRTISLSLPLNAQAAAHNPKPAVHHMTMLPDADIGSGSLRFAMDYVAIDVLREELEAAERAQGVTVGDGDILLVRTGHPRRLSLPHPRAGDQRDGRPSPGLPAAGGPPSGVRGRRALGVPIHGRAAADRRRDGLPPQPDRGPVAPQ